MTRILAQMEEADGKVSEACDVLQEVQVVPLPTLKRNMLRLAAESAHDLYDRFRHLANLVLFVQQWVYTRAWVFCWCVAHVPCMHVPFV